MNIYQNTLIFLNEFTLNTYVYLNYYLALNSSVIYSIKLVAMLSFLLLMRGGTPRYRYDYLTKLGWLKFLSFNLSIILIVSMLYFII